MKTWKPVEIDKGDFLYEVTEVYDREHTFRLNVSGPTSMLKTPWLSVVDYWGRASIPLPDHLRLCELVDIDETQPPALVIHAADMLGGIVPGNVLQPEDYEMITTLRIWIKERAQ